MLNKIINLILCMICFILLTTSCKTKDDSSLSTLVQQADDKIYLYYSAEAKDGTSIVCRQICKEVPNPENLTTVCQADKYIPEYLLDEAFTDLSSVNSFKKLIRSDLLLTKKSMNAKTETTYIRRLRNGSWTTEVKSVTLNLETLNTLFSEYWNKLDDDRYNQLGDELIGCQSPNIRKYPGSNNN